MFNVALVLFREVLEISLIIGIIVAATKDIARSSRWVSFGIMAGVSAAVLLGYSINKITLSINGTGQDIFNLTTLLVAIFMISQTVIWMRKHASTISDNIKQIGMAASEGNAHLYMISCIIAMAILREAIEIIVFCYGIKAAQQLKFSELFTGIIAGSGLAIIFGSMMYFGLINIARKHLFTVTSWFMILLAAGMAAQVPNYLASLNIFTAFSTPLWDSSWLLSEEAFLGSVIHVVMGYTAKPSATQLAFYLLTLAIILGFSKIKK